VFKPRRFRTETRRPRVHADGGREIGITVIESVVRSIISRSVPRRVPVAIAALLVLGGLALFWGALLVAAAVNPAYSHRRDYVSTLAAHGAAHGWLGVLAIAAAGGAMVPAGILIRPLSRPAAVAFVLAGIGFVVVSFSRLDCPNGAARCGLGGRFAISGSTEVTHWTAATFSTVLVIAGIALTSLALFHERRTLPGLLTLAAAAVTAGAFLATGGQTPGEEQRVGILVATGWLAAIALAVLVRPVTSKSAPAASRSGTGER
jgi:hypothetical membrane protein